MIRVISPERKSEYKANVFLPLIIATSVNIPIIPALIIGALTPTNNINKIIISIVIRIDIRLPRKTVKVLIIEANIVILIPDKTTR